jgi:N-acetylornithine carbamoyltransferase
MQRVRAAAAASGGAVHETSEAAEALEGAHIIYAKEWGCTTHYGDETADATLRRRYKNWCVDSGWFAKTAADCRLMHCLPVRRNVAVTDEVLDGPRSIVLRQAYNRLTVQMAVLHRLLKD